MYNKNISFAYYSYNLCYPYVAMLDRLGIYVYPPVQWPDLPMEKREVWSF